ncbi:muconolactone delta-isomerase [Hymenobacter psoromatis]|nr:muconolactone delta-isomerase [Hymenobacter psoromatis]
MEFLLNITIHFTPDVAETTRQHLIQEEHTQAYLLQEQGHLVRIWRIPAQFGNWGLWRAEDATQLHALITGLPLYPWMQVAVHPLARHPLDPPGADGRPLA